MKRCETDVVKAVQALAVPSIAVSVANPPCASKCESISGVASPSKQYLDIPSIEAPSTSLVLDTTDGSLLHRLAGYRPPSRQNLPSPWMIYVIAVLVTYVPLILAAWLSPLPIAEPTATLRLPFLYDWNVAFMFVVSFPLVLVLTITDQNALEDSLQQVLRDGIVLIPSEAAATLSSKWRRKFRSVNIAAQVFGIGIGGTLAFFNYRAYAPQALGYWIARENQLLPVGLIFLGCIFLFYSLLPIFVLRSFATSLFLKDLVAHAEIRMLPFHPDNSAGLGPVGHLGLRNQYALTVGGVNVVLLIFVSLRYLSVPSSLSGLMVAAAVAYVILGPLVFIGPFLPFRAAMLANKTELMSEVAQRLRIELQRVRKELVSGEIRKEDEDLIDRLRKLGAVINELPVWPFDAGTLRKFLTAYVIPGLSAIIFPMVKPLIANVTKWLRP